MLTWTATLPFRATAAEPDDWTRFRGPGATGIAASDDEIPTTWSESENIVWKSELPGEGTSSPIVWEDRIFMTAYSGYGENADEPGEPAELKLHAFCVDRESGEILWDDVKDASAEVTYRGFMSLHGYASPSAAVDEEAVYFFFGHFGVFAYSHDGDQLWKADVGDGSHGWGYSSSPVLHEDLVIISASVESQSIRALEKETGEEVWRQDGIEEAWGTPLIVTAADGRRELVVSMKGRVLALDPATGEPLWECKGVDDYVCPSVIADDDLVFITAGRKPDFFAVKAGGEGDVTESHIVWRVSETSKVGTPLYHEGHVYFIDQRGTAFCLDAANGDVVYEERIDLKGKGDRVYASYILAGDRLITTSREDGAIVVAATPEFRLLARNHIEGDPSIVNATPTPDDGQLLFRTSRYLYCIAE
jgi:hypothetical protein